MLTTKHVAEEHYSGKILYRTGEPIYKPCAVVDYCHEMGGVDSQTNCSSITTF